MPAIPRPRAVCVCVCVFCVCVFELPPWPLPASPSLTHFLNNTRTYTSTTACAERETARKRARETGPCCSTVGNDHEIWNGHVPPLDFCHCPPLHHLPCRQIYLVSDPWNRECVHAYVCEKCRGGVLGVGGE